MNKRNGAGETTAVDIGYRSSPQGYAGDNNHWFAEVRGLADHLGRPYFMELDDFVTSQVSCPRISVVCVVCHLQSRDCNHGCNHALISLCRVMIEIPPPNGSAAGASF